MSSIQDEFNSEVTDIHSAKAAVGWALEKAEGLSLSIQSLKEQLEQKNHEIKLLLNQNLELQKNIQQTEFEKSSLLQKIQSFQDEVTSLLVQVSEKEKEKLDLQRKQMEEAIALERNFEGIRSRLLQDREMQLRDLNAAKEDEIKKLTLEWNQEINRLKEELLKKENAFRQRESERTQEFQNWKSRIVQEYAQKQMELSLEYSKKELSLRSSAEMELQQSVQKLRQEKAEMENRLFQETETFHSTLSKKQEEFSKQLEEQTTRWKNILHTRDEFFQAELEKSLKQMREDFAAKEKVWLDQKQKLEMQISQMPNDSELVQQQALREELENKIKALTNQKEYLSKFNQMLGERKIELETDFSQFLNHISELKSAAEPYAPLLEDGSPIENPTEPTAETAPAKVSFFSLSFPTFKKLFR